MKLIKSTNCDGSPSLESIYIVLATIVYVVIFIFALNKPTINQLISKQKWPNLILKPMWVNQNEQRRIKIKAKQTNENDKHGNFKPLKKFLFIRSLININWYFAKI